MATNPTKSNGERLIEWQASIAQIAWGMFLIVPVDTFAGPQYALMATIAPENVWGAVSISLGFMRVSMLVVNGSWRRSPAFRLLGSIIGIMWWLMTGYLLISGPEHHIPAGVVFYLVFTVFEGISCWRSAVDAFHSGAFRSTKGVRGVA